MKSIKVTFMKTKILTRLSLLSLFTVAILTYSCTNDLLGNDMEISGETSLASSTGTVTLLSATEDATTFLTDSLPCVFNDSISLSDADLVSLLKMKEEEKLARDVYAVFNAKWGKLPFKHISKAEDTHLKAVVSLLKLYNLPDTIIAEAGKFSDVKIQALYDEMILKGDSSIINALSISALIEEMDIADIKTIISSTTNRNLLIVFENLLKGSRNHLRAFDRQLKYLGIKYSPLYISVEEYNQIVTTDNEQGNSYNKGNNGNHYAYGKYDGKGNNDSTAVKSNKGYGKNNATGDSTSVKNRGHKNGGTAGSDSTAVKGRGYKGGNAGGSDSTYVKGSGIHNGGTTGSDSTAVKGRGYKGGNSAKSDSTNVNSTKNYGFGNKGKNGNSSGKK